MGKYDPVVIIIDALDECENDDDRALLIHLFSSAKIMQSQHLKIFMTSRPELPLRLGFKAVDNLYQGLPGATLHEMPEPVVERDICTVQEYELAKIRRDYHSSVTEDQQLAMDWPSQSDVKCLAKMAVPLFIFAATVCRFIADRRCGTPDKQLQEVL